MATILRQKRSLRVPALSTTELTEAESSEWGGWMVGSIKDEYSR